jgi:predicted membrane chloride channel (bestrophin family)
MSQDALNCPSGVWNNPSTFYDEYEKASLPKSKTYTWEELQSLEAQRRSILRRSELPFWKILGFWDGTCLRALSSDWLLWLTLGIYAVIRLLAHMDGALPNFVNDLGNTDIDVIGGFLSFFLVLFVNQSNGRFNDMYSKSMDCERRIFDLASLVGASLPQPNAKRMVRYLNAAHAAGYVGLSNTYTKRHFFDRLNATYHFLTEPELTRINETDMDRGPEAFREILEWCLLDINVACRGGYVDGREAGVWREKVLQFRGSMDTLYDYCDQPIHFFYIHFLCLLSALYLPLFAMDNAYSAGSGNEAHWSADVLAGLIVLLQAIFVIGLRMLGQRMVDPYGADLEDLSVLHYVIDAWLVSNRILETQFPAEVSPQVEEEMSRRKLSLGYAWDPRPPNTMT